MPERRVAPVNQVSGDERHALSDADGQVVDRQVSKLARVDTTIASAVPVSSNDR